MNIKRLSNYKNIKLRKIRVDNGGVSMAVLAKPMDFAFVVRESKIDDFISHKSNKSKLEAILNKAKKIEKNIGSNN